MADIHEIAVETCVRTFEDLAEKIQKDFDKKFGQVCRLIRRARWKGHFNTIPRKTEQFGRWNK